jgi:hypothetical protein
MKDVRVLGVDDSYFVPHSSGRVPVVGVVMRLSGYIDGFLVRSVEIDGVDATESIVDMFNSKYGKDIRVVMTQGITMGGFNIIDMNFLHALTGVSVIVISRKQPDFAAMKTALRQNFVDWESRYELLKQNEMYRVKNGDGEIWVQSAGISLPDVKEILQKSTIRGTIPEPVRLAHLIASALYFGESKGKP